LLLSTARPLEAGARDPINPSKETQTMSIRSLLPTLWPSSGNGAHDPFMALRHEVDRAFESFGRSLPSVTWPQDAVVPRVNVTRKDKMLEVTAELPGVELKDVELLVDNDMLTIKGEKRHEKEDKSEERHLYECSYGAFSRTIPLPFEVEPKSVTAAFKNGVLTVSIPVPADVHPKAKRVEIKAAA
jgi:HSP20 family protein